MDQLERLVPLWTALVAGGIVALLAFACGQGLKRTLAAPGGQMGIFYWRGDNAPSSVFKRLKIPFLSWRWTTVYLPVTIRYEGKEWMLQIQWIIVAGGTIIRTLEACEEVKDFTRTIQKRRMLDGSELSRFKLWYEPAR